jgi:aspartate/methionine/tyrosine aminotransferase
MPDDNGSAGQTQPTDSLTAWQMRSLRNQYNLSDGHARDTLTPGEKATLLNVATYLAAPYEDQAQDRAEQSFVEAFLACAGENETSHNDLRPMFQYSASCGIELIGAALASSGVDRIGVLHPSFDNIPQLLRRAGLRVIAIDEPAVTSGSALIPTDQLQALFLTVPNNPTGWVPRPADLISVASACAAQRIPLIVDLTFRFQLSLTYPIYGMLREIRGLELITIEDTGKTWNLNDLKASFLTANTEALRQSLLAVTEELLLNVSPALLVILTAIMSLSVDPVEGSPLSIRRSLARENLARLHAMLAHHGVTLIEGDSWVAWVPLPTQWNANTIASLAEGRGVSILPGDDFLWSSASPPPYIRVALLRDREYFDRALEILDSALSAYRLSMER